MAKLTPGQEKLAELTFSLREIIKSKLHPKWKMDEALKLNKPTLMNRKGDGKISGAYGVFYIYTQTRGWISSKKTWYGEAILFEDGIIQVNSKHPDFDWTAKEIADEYSHKERFNAYFDLTKNIF